MCNERMSEVYKHGDGQSGNPRFVSFKLVAFDLDDTLAPSKSVLPEQVVGALCELAQRVPVAIISGANVTQFETQVLRSLEEYLGGREELLERFHILPTCGTQYRIRKNGNWQDLYRELLEECDRELAIKVLREEAERLQLWVSNPYGEIIEDRGSQITFSALGQQAPVDEKKRWDESGQKKNALRDAVQKRLPHLEVRSGGSTSVDITRAGIDKAYGMRKLADQTGIPLEQMLFIGDRLDEHGNDYPVRTIGVPSLQVGGWTETVEVLSQILCAAKGEVRVESSRLLPALDALL